MTTQQELKKILEEEECPEAVLYEAASVFTLILTLANSKEQLITGHNISLFLKYINLNTTQQGLVQEAVETLHDLDNKGLPMDSKFFPLALIRRLNIKMLHDQNDVVVFHQKVRLLLNRQLYYDTDTIEKWDQLYFMTNKPDIEVAIRDLYRNQLKGALQMQMGDFGIQWIVMANRVMSLISLSSHDNDKLIVEVFSNILGSLLPIRLVDSFVRTKAIVSENMMEYLKAMSYIYTCYRYQKLRSYFDEDFIMLNPQLWELVINCVQSPDESIRKQAIITLALLCKYIPRFTVFIYKDRFDLMGQLINVYKAYDDINSMFEFLTFAKIWIRQFRELSRQGAFEDEKGVVSGFMGFVLSIVDMIVPVQVKVAAIKVAEEALVTLKNINQNEMILLCKFPAIFLKNEPLLIGATLELICGILRAQAYICCEVFLSSVEFKLFITSTLENQTGPHFICMTILLELSSHENSKKFLFEKSLLQSFSQHIKVATISTARILSRLLRRMVEEARFQESKFFLLYENGILNTLIGLLPMFCLPNTPLNQYFNIPSDLIQDMETFINCFVSIYSLFGLDHNASDSSVRRKVEVIRQNLKEQHISTMMEAANLFFDKSNRFLVKKTLGSEVTIRKSQHVKFRLVRVVTMMMEEMLLFFHETPLIDKVKELRMRYYSGLYKHLNRSELEEDKVPLIISVTVQVNNQIAVAFRIPKINFATFKKAVFAKIDPYFAINLGSFEMEQVSYQRPVNSETEYQKVINEIISSAEVEASMRLNIKINNVQKAQTMPQNQFSKVSTQSLSTSQIRYNTRQQNQQPFMSGSKASYQGPVYNTNYQSGPNAYRTTMIPAQRPVSSSNVYRSQAGNFGGSSEMTFYTCSTCGKNVPYGICRVCTGKNK